MRRIRPYVKVLLAVVTLGCLSAGSTTAPPLPAGKIRVLFVGNSLTYTNNLPSLVLALDRAAGDTMLEAQTVAYSDYSLEDHWNEGTAKRQLQQNKYEFVVMQQGSSALPASQVHLSTWTSTWAPIIRNAGAEPVLFMVWPTIDRAFDFPNVRASYRNAAAAVHGIFAPAGDAWAAMSESGANPAVYSSDGLHPTLAGTYVSALVILERLRGIAPERVPHVVQGVGLSESNVIALQQAARTALDRNPARP
jgi:hypothetical protein